jgi:hypothetical protein
LAKTSTMPVAMVPEPTTPTVDTGRTGCAAVSAAGVCGSGTTTGESTAS